MSRWLRIGTSVAVLAVLLTYGIIAGGGLFRRNLALHRRVTMSSVYSSGDVGRDPSRLVDGDTTEIGFHTERAANQYVTIDLGKVQRIHRVVVYNRTDCCQDRAVPLFIEVSTDGKAYQQVGTRTTTFNEWDAEFPPIDARYVKLRRPKLDYFHLAEVEVY